MDTLKIALDWTPNVNHLGFFIAKEKGFYQELGVTVSFLNPQEDDYQTHTYLLKWIDADSFIIIGYTQPAEPTALESEMLKGYTPSFNLTGADNGTFRFVLGDQHQADCIYRGSLIPIP
ncbi:ABC transporter substrate-binding protein [Flavobacterium sp.]|uniref:ABC transporter substrate-binding protein n=1 Tax=Flavobacterium sp. TaxID=239 RepID=UPI002615F916|nr:ABC transporter substrate-binding protein [Flavobacterium sp.]